MPRHTKLLVPMVALVLTCSVLAVPRLARAHEGEDPTTTSGQQADTDPTETEQARDQLSKLAEQRKEAAAKRKEALQQKLAEHQDEAAKKKQLTFQKACENREANFQNRMENISVRLQRHITTLDKITDRVKAFKEEKNLNVANYDALVVEITTKRQVAQDLIDTTKEKATTFTCGTNHDEAQANLMTFKDALKQEIDALKDYKTAVKNLIVAVKTAQGGAQEGASNEND